MRLTCWLFGHEVLAIDLGAGEDGADPLRDLGATGSTPVGFVASHTVPAEADGPWRTPAWDEPEERR